jgi:biopolymer transport protein ExbB
VGVIAYTGYHYLTILIDKFTLRVEVVATEFLDILQEPTKV